MIFPHKSCHQLRLRDIPVAGIIGILVVCKNINTCRTAIFMIVLICVMLVVGMMCAPVGATVIAGMMGMCVCVPVAVCVGMDILTWGLSKQKNKGRSALSVAFVHAVTHG